jgi:methylmalonyl-CoA mutase cobalamin-binding subunit
MGEMDLQGFEEKCIEAGIGGVLRYIGGILSVGAHDFKEDEAIFRKLGFDRIYPPQSDPQAAVHDLITDLKGRGRL